METRRGGKRARNAAPAAAPTKRRRGANPTTAAGRAPRAQEDVDGHKTEAPLAEDSGWSQESTGGIKPHKLGSRRGAPPPLEPGDIEPATPRKETEDAEEEDDEELVDGRASDAPQDDMGDEVTARLQVMRLSLPDLANATGKLVNQLRNPQRGSRVYEYMLGSKRKVFLATRETYEGDSPFIDADQSGDFGQHTNMGASILGSANLASALDIVEMLQSKNEQGVLGQLIELDEFFHKLLVPSDDNAPEVDLSLDIRTLRLIETLAAKKQKGDIKPTIASIFCENFESRGKTDYPHLFMNAPRRPLGHREDDDVYDSCSDRITDIIGMTKDKRVSAVNRLRENFPQESILEELRKWLLSAYDSTVARGSSRRVSSTPKRAEDEFYDAEERPSGDDADSEVVSQIVRAESQQMPSLFKNAGSLRALDKAGRRAPVPPSNQRQEDAPLDYHNHTNEDLLGARPPSEVGDTSTKNAPDSSANRDEEDEEDPFQEDERQVDPGRTATISHNLQTAPQPTPSTSMPPPSLPSRTLTEPTSSAPAAPSLSPLDLINQQKRTFTQQHRATATPTLADFRQRHPWSNEDAEMLIHLIGERHAAWSLIERADKSKFQRPRHQQAYRDKARNMKVDFLMTDAVLPPCFDLVTLGKKEIDRLINYGKNPFRREKDVNTTGRAINTEYNG